MTFFRCAASEKLRTKSGGRAADFDLVVLSEALRREGSGDWPIRFGESGRPRPVPYTEHAARSFHGS